MNEVNTEVKNRLIYCNLTIPQMYYCAGWQISPESLPGISARHSTAVIYSSRRSTILIVASGMSEKCAQCLRIGNVFCVSGSGSVFLIDAGPGLDLTYPTGQVISGIEVYGHFLNFLGAPMIV